MRALMSHPVFTVEVYQGAESVLLPCEMPFVTGLATAVWSHYDLNPPTVHQHQQAREEQNRRYSSRTSMKIDALQTGDFSLTLRKPHLSDSGTYTCTIREQERRLTDIQLQVKGQEQTQTPALITGQHVVVFGVHISNFHPCLAHGSSSVLRVITEPQSSQSFRWPRLLILILFSSAW
uniref:Ig-like domain-containing protein n=1 Tax=Amphilophus citrinellus TaxID=61819 RepID=A0A3Q0RL54_AMPCI